MPPGRGLFAYMVSYTRRKTAWCTLKLSQDEPFNWTSELSSRHSTNFGRESHDLNVLEMWVTKYRPLIGTTYKIGLGNSSNANAHKCAVPSKKAVKNWRRIDVMRQNIDSAHWVGLNSSKSAFSVNQLVIFIRLSQNVCCPWVKYPIKVNENSDGCESWLEHLCCWFRLKTRITSIIGLFYLFLFIFFILYVFAFEYIQERRVPMEICVTVE